MLGITRKGSALYFTYILLIVMTLFCTLAVDYGRVQLAKTELQRAVDAAARAGAAAIPDGVGAARAQAKLWASKNTVAGQGLTITDADIVFLKYNNTTKTYDITTSANPDAVRILGKCEASRGNAIPLMWGSIFGRSSLDIHAKSAARYQDYIAVDQTVKATANPFLAGAPNGTVASQVNPHYSPDHAPAASPEAVAMVVKKGDVLTFDNISGTARHDPDDDMYQPDGDLADIGHNNLTTSDSNSKGATMYSQNGIADTRAPINALVGIFLSDSAPDPYNTPDTTDFSSSASRDFAKLTPKLNQIFFIGDGLDHDGIHQEFVAPEGATRLFLATWDFYEWNNNAGERVVKVNRPGRVVTIE